MKALVTGLTGFAGGFLAEHLIAQGDDVLGCSNRGRWPRPGHWPADVLAILSERVSLFAWDIGQTDGLAEADRAQIARFAPDCIYHLGAISVPESCAQDPERATAVNTGGVERVLDLACSLSPKPRVLFVSSSHVYAPAGPGSAPLDENAPLGPRPGYGVTKLAAEQSALQAVRERGVHAIIARAFQHTGPRQDKCMMLPEWAAQFASPGPEPVRVRNRHAWIDLTDVRDVVRAYRVLVERGEAGGIYNVGSGVARRSGDVLDLLAGYAGGGRQIIEQKPEIKYDPIANNERLVAATGWRPEISIETTVSDTLQYWRQRILEA